VRILAIRGENLASLADRFEIDFENEPLRSAGLFAITGETGAGKSTILDALCLALYDSFPRVDSQGADAGALDSSGQTLAANDPRSILRRGASRGFAEVDFLGRDGSRYRARCELARARGKATGNLQPRLRSLRQIDDAGAQIAAVASGVEEVRRKIIELTELTFDQFRRTVLLAQGDFDAFLRADSKERAELLEKITGAAIYAVISKRVFQRSKEAEAEVASLERRLADIRLLSDDERAVLSSHLRNAEGQRATLLKLREEILCKLRRHEAIAIARDRAAHANAERDAALAGLEALTGLRERLELLERAEPLRALANEKANAETDLQEAKDARESAQATETAAREIELALREEERLAAEALGQSESEVQHFLPLWSQAENLDAKISVAALESERARKDAQAAQETLRKKHEMQSLLAGKLQKLHAELRVAQEGLAKLSAARPLHEQWRDIDDWLQKRSGFALQCAENELRLTQLRRDSGRHGALLATLDAADERDRAERDRLEPMIMERANALAALDEAAAQARSRELETLFILLGKLALAARRYAEAALSKARAATDFESATRAAQAETDAIASLREARALNEARREETERLGELADATASQEALRLRASLVEGEPCPVCGARDHPHAHTDDAAQALVSSLRARREELRAAIADTNARLARASERVGAARAHAADAQRRIENASGEQGAAARDYSQAIASWPNENRAPPLAIEGAEAELQKLSDKLSEEREENSRKLDHAQALRADGDALRQTRDAHASAIDDRREGKEAAAREHASADAEALRLDAETIGMRERIDSIDRSLAPFLALCDLTPGDFDRDATSVKGRLARKGEDYRAASLLASELLAKHNELLPRAAAAESEAREAGKYEQAAREKAAERARDEQVLRNERTTLLEGEATQTHRERLNKRLREARQRLAIISGDSAKASIALAATSERAMAATQAAVRTEEKSNAAQSAWRESVAGAGLEETTCAELLAITQAKRDEMASTLHAARQRETLAQAAAKERQRDLDEALREGGAGEGREDLSARAAQLDEELASLGEKLGADKERIAADDEVRSRAGQLGAERDAAKRLHQTWSEINAAIGSASGDKFRRFAQSVTLDHLIALANRQFSVLSPRYALERIAGDNGDLGLQIIDRDMAEERRSTRSLSGGERFLASLALALALCSLEGRNSFVDTLFIDEGFGSLDSATLDVAIDALETLQSHGRRVGVISHVESMHQRIATQIRVEKRGGGKSVVRTSWP
jgi:exonuclease SbcC